MALILCPHCEAVHEIEQPFQAMEGKKVRCASCRQIFAVQHEALHKPPIETLELSEPFPVLNQGHTNQSENNADPSSINQSQTLRPSPAFESDLPLEWDEPLPPHERNLDERTSFSAMSLPIDHQEGLGMGFLGSETNNGIDIQSDRSMAKKRRSTKHRPSARKFNPFALFAPNNSANGEKPAQRTMVMAAGIASLFAIGVARHDIVRLMPQVAPVFDVVGLPVNLYGLEFDEIKSRITTDSQGETLEITGGIRNVTRQAMPIPMLRLAIQNAGAQDVFVWTAHTDIKELAPGESHQFRRRLASPPMEANRVVVRFLAKDDVITAIK